MIKEIGIFIGKLLGFSALLLLVHYYILSQFFSGDLVFPLWSIYIFNMVLVLAVYLTLRYYSTTKPQEIFKIFLILTILKMVLAVVFLLPLFLQKSNHTQLEVFNFFIPYFLFLIFEIFALNRFLQKT